MPKRLACLGKLNHIRSILRKEHLIHNNQATILYNIIDSSTQQTSHDKYVGEDSSDCTESSCSYAMLIETNQFGCLSTGAFVWQLNLVELFFCLARSRLIANRIALSLL